MSDDRTDRSLLDALVDLLETVDGLDPGEVASGRNRIDRGSVSVDVSYTVGTGLGDPSSGGSRSTRRPRRTGRDASSRRSNASGRPPTRSSRRSSDGDRPPARSTDPHVDVLEYDGERVLAADLPAVDPDTDPDAVAVTVEDAAVTIQVDGDAVECIALEPPLERVETRVRNGLVFVHLGAGDR